MGDRQEVEFDDGPEEEGGRSSDVVHARGHGLPSRDHVQKHDPASKGAPLVEPLSDEYVERSLLGSALIDDETLRVVAETLEWADFSTPGHAAIWKTMCEMRHEGCEVDAVTLGHALREKGIFDQVGGAAFMDFAIECAPVVSRVGEQAKILAHLAWRRRFRGESRRLHVMSCDLAATREQLESQMARVRGASEETTDEIPFMTSVELHNKTWPTPSGWLVHNILRLSACGLIVGDPKTAKSIVAASMCMSVVSGVDFLRRYPVSERGPAIYINGEDNEQLTQERLPKIAANLGIPYPLQDLIVSCQPPDANIETNRGWGRIAKLVRRIKPKLTAIDCFRRFAPKTNENRAEQVSPILCRLRDLQKETGTSVLLVHHIAKENEWNKNAKPLQRIRGSGEFYAWMDDGIGMEHPDRKKPEHYMTTTHRAGADDDDVTLLIRWNDQSNEVQIDFGEPRSKKSRQRSLADDREPFG